MTKQEKLISLLQPSNYKSKIKLFCAEIKTEKIVPQKVADNINSRYLCKVIEIKPIEK